MHMNSAEPHAEGFPARESKTKRQKKEKSEREQHVLVEVGGFELTQSQHQRYKQMEDRLSLRDPAKFGVNLYAGFHAHGVVEVMENGLRSLMEHLKDDGEELSVPVVLYNLLPLTVFWKRNAGKAIGERPDVYERIDQLLDVLAGIWKIVFGGAFADAALKAQLQSFSVYCTDVLEVYAHWEFLEEENAVGLDDNRKQSIRECIRGYLLKHFPWHSNDEKEMLTRQQEMVISPEIVKAMTASPKREQRDHDPPKLVTPKKVVSQLRKIR